MTQIHVTNAHLAQEFLARSPVILSHPDILCLSSDGDGQFGLGSASPAQVTAHIWQVVAGCIDAEPVALRSATRIVESGLSVASLTFAQTAAAWHALLSSPASDDMRNTRLWHDVLGISPAPHPLVSDLIQTFHTSKSSRMDGADVLVCQHLLGSIVPELTAIRSLIKDSRFWEVQGKPYSANLAAIHALVEEGFEVNAASCQLPPRGRGPGSYRLGGFAHRHRQVVRASVRRFFDQMSVGLAQSTVPILVIDDGGALIDAVARAATTRKCTRPIVAIEQTQRGLHATSTYVASHLMPIGGLAVINVAQSMSKLVLESELIASSVIENALSLVEGLVSDGLSRRAGSDLRIGIIGYGSVGESIAQALTYTTGLKNANLASTVTVYDRNANRTAAAGRRGCDVAWSLEELLSNADIVIAATGGAGLSSASSSYLSDGAILASASSGDVEFRGLANLHFEQSRTFDDLIPGFDRVHGLITAHHHTGQTVYVLNGGFPVNFNGQVDPIEPSRIQLTRALMVAAVLQSLGTAGNGSDELDGDEDLVGRTGVFRLAGRFDKFLFSRSPRTTDSMRQGS